MPGRPAERTKMKVVSVNREKTVGFKQIAFNVDQELSPEFVSKISYGSLKITGSGTVLIVQLPADADTPFSAASVSTLNQKLSDAQDAIDEATAKREKMLQAIANNVGLPLA